MLHITLLKPYHTIEGWALALPPFIDVDKEDQAAIKEVLDSCVYYSKLQYLVKWLGYAGTDNKWVTTNNLGFAKEYVGKFDYKYPSKPLSEHMH